MYESDRVREKPGRGCLVAFLIVAVIVIGVLLFVRFGVPKIIGKLIAEGKTSIIIPAAVSEQLNEHRADVQAALKEYNIDAKSMKKTIDSLTADKVLRYSDDVLSGKIANADQAVEELFSQLDFGSANVERLKKELKDNASYGEFQDIARQIQEQKKLIKAGLPFIKDTIKSFIGELIKAEH
ncbi:MAG: hypothetical protein JW874_01320 [Spirochaetales bacterium]|nr:hypothetical protein [Spirochaetales bacterium]